MFNPFRRRTRHIIDSEVVPTRDAPRPDVRTEEGDRPDTSGRRFERVTMAAQVDFGSESNFYNGFSENISEGGIFIASEAMHPLGTEMSIQFKLPNMEEAIEIDTVVRWVREASEDGTIPPGMGLQFKDLDPAVHAAIQGFVHRRDPIFYLD